MTKTKEQRMEITKKELFFAAATARDEAWDAHKRAEQVFFKTGSIVQSKAWFDYIRTYTLYKNAAKECREADRAWMKERTDVR